MFPRTYGATWYFHKRNFKPGISSKILPNHVPLSDVIKQTGNAAGLTSGLLRDNYELIGWSFPDVIAEPVYKIMISGFETMMAGALNAEALECSIS